MNDHLKNNMDIFRLFKEGKIEKAEELFCANNKNFFEVSESGWNWLHQLLMGVGKDLSSIESIKYFIDKGVSINSQDCYGMTPLHYAMRSRNADAAKVLLEAGADPNIPNIDNLRPLSMIGYIPDRLDVLELMLEKGGNVDQLMGDNSGRTILESWLPYPGVPDIGNLNIYELMKKYSKNIK